MEKYDITFASHFEKTRHDESYNAKNISKEHLLQFLKSMFENEPNETTITIQVAEE